MYSEPLSLVKEKEECIKLTQACKITRIECFRFDCELADRLHSGHGSDCHCGLLTLSTNLGTCGLGEFVIPCGSLKGDFVQWAIVFQKLKGLTPEDGLHYIHQKEEAWGEVRTHLIESALTDLSAKLEHSAGRQKELSFLWNRNYLFEHSGAYISF
ncbi:hypothetical protein [Paenibacillus aceris]|uniref:Uncharacterized protein n=1 Tax=Paenibacillus aceris TaxID=869555 RepID=A0ABS4I606_9BACL|nr:hypothetical protein [Paenibacillus aceris]MBP1965966.1 hypothetical protein [Paenibacillus aceris]NHW35036.1 hypothetical protein [Paenibacillus aceris]